MRQCIGKVRIGITMGRSDHVFLFAFTNRHGGIGQIRDREKDLLKGLISRFGLGFQLFRAVGDSLHAFDRFHKLGRTLGQRRHFLVGRLLSGTCLFRLSDLSAAHRV